MPRTCEICGHTEKGDGGAESDDGFDMLFLCDECRKEREHREN